MQKLVNRSTVLIETITSEDIHKRQIAQKIRVLTSHSKLTTLKINPQHGNLTQNNIHFLRPSSAIFQPPTCGFDESSRQFGEIANLAQFTCGKMCRPHVRIIFYSYIMCLVYIYFVYNVYVCVLNRSGELYSLARVR